ncbi:MAG: primosomal protein N' [Spirochaetaceae bacterium]|jgi:primosomal protein N' (replication factor Y)|nr:primosomal protein N' [Spirochaetaceae bacterium]
MAPYFELIFGLPLPRRFTYRADDKGEAAVGKRALVPFGQREMTGFIVGQGTEKPDGLDEAAIKAIRRVVDTEPLFGSGEIELAQWIAGFYLCSEGEALSAMLPSGHRTKELPTFGVDEISRTKLDLSPEQDAAFQAVIAANREDAGKPCYLYGITGSGKTEVFLRAAEFFLDRGQGVIYLVPEIALSKQTAEDVKARFGQAACTLHSGLSGSEKLSYWQKIRAGEVRVVIGPRSAVFAPVVNLGLVIIDEEHDGSYKSGNTPRYHARQVAMKRATISKAVLVMGSATPSVESWRLMQEGAIRKLPLTRRLAGGAVPHISAVNLEGVDGCLSPLLRSEIAKTAAMRRQTILFLNRRGFAYFYHCHSCGYELRCKHCSVSLTYHKSSGKAVCHYCGYKTAIPDSCPQCGSLDAGFAGFGTELVEETVRRTFPDLRVARADADNIADIEHTLAFFKAGHIDILLGTQMVAKGLNFPGVRLVGVILADTALHLPDFRARERTFSLLVQVAGRAGRYFPDGKVLVQTFRPNDSAIASAVRLDVDGFFDAELAVRREQDFPPYSRLIRFVIRSRNLAKAEAAVNKLSSLIRRILPKTAELLGPAPCPIELHADNYRRQIILRAPIMDAIHAAAAKAFAVFNTDRDPKVYLEADVDPVSLL